jgi:hypothetical protein
MVFVGNVPSPFCKGISNISMKETAAGSVFLGEHGKAGDVMRRSG